MSSTEKKVVYVEFTKSTLTIWKHFLRAKDGQSAKCKKCHNILKTAGGATTGLHTHLRSKHPDVAFPPTNLEDDSESSAATPGTSTASFPSTSTAAEYPPAKQRNKRKLVTDYFKSDVNESMEIIVSRMTELDGVSFRLFCESQDLRKLFKKSGYELPKSGNTIAKIVFDQAEDTKAELKKNIIIMKNEGIRFTVTLDEWTSQRSRRYMNINIHSREFGGFNFKNLGLVRITGSMPAGVALEILRDHLLKFHVSIDEDVISITTDGASVMKKMGTYFHGHHQLCLAHALQLAVIDTVYNDIKDPTTTLEPAIDDSYPSDTSDTGSDEDDDEDGRFEVEIPRVRANPYLYKEIISKVRRVVKMIRKSPLKSDALQAYVTQKFNQNMQLQLDCQTRWSSMAEMIGSFLKIKTCVMKVLIDFKSQESFTEEDIQCLLDIHQSLEIVKLTVLSLCRREATLYTADTALRFMLNKLDEQNTSLSWRLAANLRTRIKERRLLVAGVLHYLHDAESFYASPDDETFQKPISDEICDVIVNSLLQLKYRALTVTTSSRGNESPESNHASASARSATEEHPLTFQEELEKELEKCKSRTPVAREFDLRGFVVAEKAMYDNQGERGVYLTEAYNYLLSILPTSVENERVFSSAGYFCNKIRSSLSDRMLDSLSFLRSFFQEKRSLENN